MMRVSAHSIKWRAKTSTSAPMYTKVLLWFLRRAAQPPASCHDVWMRLVARSVPASNLLSFEALVVCDDVGGAIGARKEVSV